MLATISRVVQIQKGLMVIAVGIMGAIVIISGAFGLYVSFKTNTFCTVGYCQGVATTQIKRGFFGSQIVIGSLMLVACIANYVR